MEPRQVIGYVFMGLGVINLIAVFAEANKQQEQQSRSKRIFDDPRGFAEQYSDENPTITLADGETSPLDAMEEVAKAVKKFWCDIRVLPIGGRDRDKKREEAYKVGRARGVELGLHPDEAWKIAKSIGLPKGRSRYC